MYIYSVTTLSNAAKGTEINLLAIALLHLMIYLADVLTLFIA
jgi:hypothetical protein